MDGGDTPDLEWWANRDADTLAADGLLHETPERVADGTAGGIVGWRLPATGSGEIRLDSRRGLWREVTSGGPIEILAVVDDAVTLSAARRLPDATAVDGVLAQVRDLSSRHRWRSADIIHGALSGTSTPAVLAVDVPFHELLCDETFPSLTGDVTVIPDEPVNATPDRLFGLMRSVDSSAVCVVRTNVYDDFVASLGDAAVSGEPMPAVLQRLARTYGPQAMIFTGLSLEQFRSAGRHALTTDRGLDFTRAIAAETPEPQESRRRFLQAEIARRAGATVERVSALVRGERFRLSVWIGPPEDGGAHDPEQPFDFDVTEPLDLDVTVVMADESPRRARRRTRKVRLEPAGSSTRAEFSIAPVSTTAPSVRFEISVAHAGGLLQVARYDVAVVNDRLSAILAAPPVLRVVAVNRSWAGAAVQPPRDAYLKIDEDGRVTAHGPGGRAVALRIDSPALVAELAGYVDQMHDLRDLAAGIGDDNVQAFFRVCARMGARLVQELNDSGASFLGGSGDLQLVSLNPWHDVPVEIAYDQASPKPREARLCEKAAEALASGTCQRCPGEESDRVCPAAFWGVRRIIERYLHEIPEVGDARHGAGVRPDRQHLPVFDTALFGASARADDDQAGTADAVRVALGELADTIPVKSWDEWKTNVATHEPALLVA